MRELVQQFEQTLHEYDFELVLAAAPAAVRLDFSFVYRDIFKLSRDR